MRNDAYDPIRQATNMGLLVIQGARDNPHLPVFLDAVASGDTVGTMQIGAQYRLEYRSGLICTDLCARWPVELKSWAEEIAQEYHYSKQQMQAISAVCLHLAVKYRPGTKNVLPAYAMQMQGLWSGEHAILGNAARRAYGELLDDADQLSLTEPDRATFYRLFQESGHGGTERLRHEI